MLLSATMTTPPALRATSPDKGRLWFLLYPCLPLMREVDFCRKAKRRRERSKICSKLCLSLSLAYRSTAANGGRPLCRVATFPRTAGNHP